MKKSNIRAFLFSLLAILSIASYTYLIGVTTTNTTTKAAEIEEIENNIYLPDVALIKQVFKTGKQIVHKAL